MILAPLDVVGVLEHMGLEPPTAAVGDLDVLGTLVEGPKLGVVGDVDAANLQFGEGLLGPKLLRLRLLRGRGGDGGGHTSRRGLIDGRAKLGLGLGDVGLKVEGLTDLAGLGDERLQFGVLLGSAVGDIRERPHLLGDGGGAILEILELLGHGRLAPDCEPANAGVRRLAGDLPASAPRPESSSHSHCSPQRPSRSIDV